MKKDIVCPICSCNKSTIVAVLDDIKFRRLLDFSARKYNGYLQKLAENVPPVVRYCLDCGHYWYQNLPSNQQLNQLYEVSKPLKNILPDHNPTKYMIREIKKLLHMVKSKKPKKEVTLLDFGSGFGRWSRAATEVGFIVTSFEPSKNRSFQQDLPYRLVGNYHQLKNQKFDSILLEQVLEHVPDPLKILEKLKNNCHQETLLKIAVPNIHRNKDGKEVWNTWPFNGDDPHILAPYEHLQGFCAKSMDIMIQKAGFKNLGLCQELRYTKFNLLRRLLGNIVPQISSTVRYVKIK
jgi:SAM-dependent methyltransferase